MSNNHINQAENILGSDVKSWLTLTKPLSKLVDSHNESDRIDIIKFIITNFQRVKKNNNRLPEIRIDEEEWARLTKKHSEYITAVLNKRLQQEPDTSTLAKAISALLEEAEPDERSFIWSVILSHRRMPYVKPPPPGPEISGDEFARIAAENSESIFAIRNIFASQWRTHLDISRRIYPLIKNAPSSESGTVALSVAIYEALQYGAKINRSTNIAELKRERK